jgi:hypothetical protein
MKIDSKLDPLQQLAFLSGWQKGWAEFQERANKE